LFLWEIVIYDVVYYVECQSFVNGRNPSKKIKVHLVYDLYSHTHTHISFEAPSGMLYVV